MVLRVQYDAYNRQFKLLDRELARVLEDGQTYLLIADVSIEESSFPDDAGIPSDVEPVLR